MNKAAIASDWSEIAIYIREIAADIEEIATNRTEMPKKTEETCLNGFETTARGLAMPTNPRFTGVSA